MKLSRALRDAGIAAILGVVAAAGIAGCAAPRQKDWREAVKSGDYAHAYLDLFETWRAGTPDVKAEALRHAWRNDGITAAARKDLVAIIQPVAERHAGDLASLRKALLDGPLEDRIDFAKLVDRSIDVDGEIKAAFERRSPRPVAAPSPPSPAAPPVAKPVAAPVAQAAPPTAPPESPKPAAPPPPPAPAPAAPQAFAPASPTPPAPAVAAAQPAPPAPPASIVERAPAKDPGDDALRAQVAEERKRSVWRCKGAAACDKAWLAAENFVASNSSMRVRTVTATLIDTYPPIVIGEIGMKVEKRALATGESELELTVICRAGKLRQLCPTAEIRLYKAFPGHLKASVP